MLVLKPLLLFQQQAAFTTIHTAKNCTLSCWTVALFCQFKQSQRSRWNFWRLGFVFFPQKVTVKQKLLQLLHSLSPKNPQRRNNCYVRVWVTVQLSDTVNKYSPNGKVDAHPHETKWLILVFSIIRICFVRLAMVWIQSTVKNTHILLFPRKNKPKNLCRGTKKDKSHLFSGTGSFSGGIRHLLSACQFQCSSETPLSQ